MNGKGKAMSSPSSPSMVHETSKPASVTTASTTKTTGRTCDATAPLTATSAAAAAAVLSKPSATTTTTTATMNHTTHSSTTTSTTTPTKPPHPPPPPPQLTPELRERIRQNRERAYRLQAERKRTFEQTLPSPSPLPSSSSSQQQQQHTPSSQQRTAQGQESIGSDHPNKARRQKGGTPLMKEKDTDKEKDAEEECEEWEVGASEWASRKEATTKYCLPQGTLVVCEVSEKANPRHKGWAPMKLYRRTELRRRAYKRFDGREGLIQERTKREQKRLAKDLKEAEDVFR